MKINSIQPSFKGLIVIPRKNLSSEQESSLKRCGESYPSTRQELRILNHTPDDDYRVLANLRKNGIEDYVYINSKYISSKRACELTLDYNDIIKNSRTKKKIYC